MRQDERIALRIPSTQLEKINALVTKGKFKNASQVVRTALNEFLESKGV